MSNATLEMMQEIEQAAQGVIVGYDKSERIHAIALQQWHSITMRKPSNWSQRQKKTPRKDSSV